MTDILDRAEPVKRRQRMHPGCAPTADDACAWIDDAVAQLKIMREALEKISDGYGPDHGSKFCANISTAALAACLDKRG